MPLTPERMEAGEHFLISDFREVYPFAVRTVQRCAEEAMSRAGVTPAEVNWLIPHHASANIIEDGLGQAGLRPDQVIMSIEHTGNTSSASVPTALDEAARAGRFVIDDKDIGADGRQHAFDDARSQIARRFCIKTQRSGLEDTASEFRQRWKLDIVNAGMRFENHARRTSDQHQDRQTRDAFDQFARDSRIAPHVPKPDRVVGIHNN